jgi:hypothetical protein
MSEAMSNNGAKSVYPAEQWPEARSLYEGGLSLQGVAGKLGIPYSTVRYHAWTEDWGVRSRGGQQDPRYQKAKAKQIRRKLEKEEKRLEQELALVKAEDLELLARRSLAAESARAKVTVSRRVTEILSRLDSSVPVRSAAQALGSLAPILRLLYGWGREPDLQRMELARSSDQTQVKSYYQHHLEGTTPPPVTGAVNLGLIATTPEQLAKLAEAKGKLDRDEVEDVSDSECNDQGMGPSAIAPEQPRAVALGPPIPKKEAPPSQAKEPAPPSRTVSRERTAPTAPEATQSALKHSVQQTSLQEPPPTPGSQAWHRQRIEELDRLRAEWRGR